MQSTSGGKQSCQFWLFKFRSQVCYEFGICLANHKITQIFTRNCEDARCKSNLYPVSGILYPSSRTDWNENMADATDWADCPELSSDDGENEIELAGVSLVSPVAHRYVQFRAELRTDDEAKTPALTRVKINYSFPAQSPVLANASGSIKFNSNYLYYPNQEIVYEHGAVIKNQEEGGFMLQEPPIIISNESGIPAIKISLVNLTGADYSYSGSTTASVKSTFKDNELLADGLKYPDLNISITTGYSRVWGDWFNKTFVEESGLDGSYYDVDVTAENVEVKFYGNGDGVELYLEKTAVEVEI